MSDTLDTLLGRFQATSDGGSEPIAPMAVSSARIFEITVKELKAAVEKNPTHPVATAFKKACRKKPDHQVMYVERPDLEALLTNREVVLTTTVESDADQGQVRVQRKTLGRSLTPPTKPVTSPKESVSPPKDK